MYTIHPFSRPLKQTWEDLEFIGTTIIKFRSLVAISISLEIYCQKIVQSFTSYFQRLKKLTFINLFSLPCFGLYIVLTSIIQESTNWRYRINVEDLLLTNTIITQKDKKPHTAGLDVPQYRTLKYKLPKYRLKIKKVQYRNTVNPNAPSKSIM